MTAAVWQTGRSQKPPRTEDMDGCPRTKTRQNSWMVKDVPAEPYNPRTIAPNSGVNCDRGSVSGAGGAAGATSSVAQTTTGAAFCLFCLPLFFVADVSVVVSSTGTGSGSRVRFFVCLERATAATLRSARSSETWDNSSALALHSDQSTGVSG